MNSEHLWWIAYKSPEPSPCSADPSLLPASAGGRVLTGDDEWSNQVSLSEGRCPLQHTLLRKGLLANPTLTSLGPTYFIWYASIEVRAAFGS